MNLTEIIAAVVVRTKRPDLEEDILLAVQQATLFCHNSEFYRRDMVELPFNFSAAPAFSGQYIVDSVLPSLRKVSYIRKWDPTVTPAFLGAFLKPVEPDQLFDYYEQKKKDVYYLAGKVINWISCTQDKGHIVGYWRFPDVGRSNYSSWIATTHPFAIVDMAASRIFRNIGQQDESKAAKEDALMELSVVKINEIESAGR